MQRIQRYTGILNVLLVPDIVCNDVLVSVLQAIRRALVFAAVRCEQMETLIYHCAVHVLFEILCYFILQQKQRVVSIHIVRRIHVVTNVTHNYEVHKLPLDFTTSHRGQKDGERWLSEQEGSSMKEKEKKKTPVTRCSVFGTQI